MRSALGRTSDVWVLTAGALLGLAAVEVAGGNPLAVLPGLLASLLAPGYLLGVILWPRAGSVSGMYRAALGIALSVTLVSVMGVAIAESPGGFSGGRARASVALLIVVLGAGAALRRLSVGGEASQVSGRLLLAMLAGATLLVGAYASRLMPVSASLERTTELFFVPVAPGRYVASDAAGGRLAVLVGVRNLEGREQAYTLALKKDGREVRREDVRLAAGQLARTPLPFEPGPGRLRVELFRAGSATPYRTLSLTLRGEEREPPP